MSTAVGDGAEIRFDLCFRQREIGFEDGEDAVGAELLVVARLRHRVRGRRRRDARDHRHAACGGFDRRLHHFGALFALLR